MVKQRFVARHAQLKELSTFLSQVLGSRGQVAFVAGEAGSGKTALVTEFARQAQAEHKDLVFTIGNCNAHTGIGDPYLPFREILIQLTGGFETKLAQGAITTENTRRLRGLVRWTCEALMEFGPDLINTLVPGVGLVTKTGKFVLEQAGWFDKFQEMVERKIAGPSRTNLEQNHIFEQYTNVLKVLTKRRPLVLVLDDLHWADNASISLLFHLGRRIAENRILILGTYRPEEVLLERLGERHPLDKVLTEFKRYLGDVWIDLNHAEENEARQFVDALLDLDPNRLGDAFRQNFVQHTGGHPLFAVELLQDMREQGDLQLDTNACWVEGSKLDWDSLPPRVEGVIEERIGRLKTELQEILTVGSVEGEEFTAEVIAQVRSVEVRSLVRRLSNELDRKHHLVVAQGMQRLGLQLLSSYRFRHNLFQKYLYDILDTTEKAYLHGDVGNALEALYGNQVTEIAVQLARHFQEAGITDKAAKYLCQAGDIATRLHAFAEARQHFSKALDILAHLPDTVETLRQRVDTLIKLVATAWRSDSPEINMTRLDQGERLARQLPGPDGKPGGDRLRLAQIHLWVGRIHYVRGMFDKAIGYYQQVLPVAQESDDIELLGIPSSAIGQAMAIQGHYDQAAVLLDQAVPLFAQTGNWEEWVRAMSFHGVALAMMGKCDEGITQTHTALTRAREINSITEIAMSHLHLILIYLFSGNLSRAVETSLQTVEMAQRSGDQVYIYLSQGLQGWAECRAGHFETAKTIMSRSQTLAHELGQSLQLADWFAVADAEIALGMGHIEQALILTDKAINLAQKMNGIFAEGLSRRVKGQALAALTPPSWHKAETQLVESLRILQSGESWLAVARTYEAWGIICRDKGDTHSARKHWEDAKAIWEKSNLPWEIERVQVLMSTLQT